MKHAALWLVIWMLWLFSASDSEVDDLKRQVRELESRVNTCRCPR